MHVLGLRGMPRRVYTYPAETGWGDLNLIASAGAAFMTTAVLLFIADMWRALRTGTPAADNPWAAGSLEWATASPPHTAMTVPKRGRGSSFASMLYLVLVTAGCSRDPGATYAQRLERAASWASSVQFTIELAQQQLLPQAYVREVLTAAARELVSLERQIAADKHVPGPARDEASGWCRRLNQLMTRVDASGAMPEMQEVRELETRLRSAARLARSGTLMEFRQ